ncbi:serine/threonine protein kinase, partial [Arthrospira platensis FACHB-439]|nr:serine/threonine protein kinase [Arthrospira platensis FACHB-439]
VAFSPNGQMLAGGCRDGSIGLWHQQDQTWKLWRTLRADDADIFAIAFKPDSTELITGNSKGQIDIWQLGDGTLLETIAAHSADVLSLAFSLDGKTIASGGSDRLVKIWYHAAQT